MVSSQSAVVDDLEASGGGVVVSSYDASEAAAALTGLCADATLRAAMAERGQAYVRRRFNRAAVMGDWMANVDAALQAHSIDRRMT